MSLLAALAQVAGARTRAVGVAPAPIERDLIVYPTSTEQGLRIDESGDALRNHTVWSDAGDGVELSHLRFGDNRPVLLGRLIECRPGRWRLAEPHLCGEDRYEASARVHGDGVTLRWRIRGPKKDQRVVTRYRR